MSSEYGLGKHPPYSLYENEMGKWGLIDGNGNKLPAVFDKIDENLFSSVPWEIVSFDENEGFQLVSWYDPFEVWFNFTFDNPAYPEDFSGYLWRKSEKKIEEYADTLFELMSEESHWLVHDIMSVEKLDRMEDEEFYLTVDAMLFDRPELRDPSLVNPLLDPVMRNMNIPVDIKIALWNAKVSLDSHIRVYLEEYPDGY